MSLIRLLLVYEMKTRSMLMKDHLMVMIKFHVWDELFLKLIKYTEPLLYLYVRISF
jgi:hypothetical protein